MNFKTQLEIFTELVLNFLVALSERSFSPFLLGAGVREGVGVQVGVLYARYMPFSHMWSHYNTMECSDFLASFYLN